MKLLDEVSQVLGEAGYEVNVDARSPGMVLFEDDALLGFVTEAQDAREIVDRWRETQDQFLATNAVQLRQDPTKAWNVYAVFLTTRTDESAHIADLVTIEEDFVGARKIVRVGLNSSADVRTALLPLLQIQNLTRGAEATDDLDKLRSRLELGDAVDALLGEADPEEIAAAIAGER